MSNLRKGPNRYRSLSALPVAAMVFFALSPAPKAAAVNVTWNVGSGTWDTTSNNWTGGVPDPLKYVENDAVFFSNVAGGTITLGANRAPASTNIDATAGTYTFTANSITAGPLTKSNAGTAILNSNFSGSAITIGGGILALGAGSGDGINPTGGIITINSGGTLRNDAANRIQNGQRIVINAGGTYNLNNQGDVVGSLSGAGGISLGTAGLLLDDMDGSNYSGVMSGTGSFTLRGNIAAGVQILSGANTYSGATTVDNGTLRVSSTLRDSSSFSVTGVGRTLEFGATNIFVPNHGTAVVNTRVISVNAGTLLFNASFDSRIGNVTLTNGATWTSNRGLGAFDALLANTSTGAATVTVGAGGTTAATMNGSGGIHLQGVQNFNVADVTASAASDLNVSMILAGPGSTGGAAGGINKLGAGTMTLSGANTYNGTTTVDDGALLVRSNSALGATGAANTILNNVAGPTGGNGTNVQFENNVTVGESFQLNTGAGDRRNSLISNSGTTTLTGPINISGGSNVNISVAAGTFNVNGNITQSGWTGGSLIVRGAGGTGNINGTIDIGGRDLFKTDGNTWIINSTGNNWNNTGVAVGTLQLGTNNALDTGGIVTMGQVDANSPLLRLNGFQQTIAGLTRNGGNTGLTTRVAGGSVTESVLTIDNSADFTYSALIGGAGTNENNLRVVKNGSGIQTLSGVNTYTGTTNIQQGTLALSGAGAIDSSPVINVSSGATFDVENSSNFNLTSIQSLIGNLGDIDGDVIADAGSIISPGASAGAVGTLVFLDDLDINGILRIDILGAGSVDLIDVTGLLDVTNATLDLDIVGPITAGSYIFASYGSLAGQFASIPVLPVQGYEIRYSFQGNNIALVSIPEPATMSLLALGGAAMLRRRRTLR